jgi:hypothetical protein
MAFRFGRQPKIESDLRSVQKSRYMNDRIAVLRDVYLGSAEQCKR